MMISERERQLDMLLDGAIASFDIPDSMYELAVSRYDDLGRWLSECSERRGTSGDVYPQGSFRLGTVVRPIGDKDQYDIGLVYRRDVSKSSLSQAKLKEDAGEDLAEYVINIPEGLPTLKEGKRCWTLVYPSDPFHMDVLPAIPDLDSADNSILLTDRDLREWQHSNPIGHSEWFREQMADEFVRLRQEAAIRMKAMDVEDVPTWRVKTTLQRAVQALKRHRDIYFQHRVEDKPTSIIITTLAAKSYVDGGTLYEVLAKVTKDMPQHIIDHDGQYWVANPVQAEENFADRWGGAPELARSFSDWIEQAHTDFNNLAAKPGMDSVLEAIGKGLGQGPARAAGRSVGSQIAAASRLGQLGLGSSSGQLSTSPRHPAPQHTFHGGNRNHCASKSS